MCKKSFLNWWLMCEKRYATFYFGGITTSFPITSQANIEQPTFLKLTQCCHDNKTTTGINYLNNISFIFFNFLSIHPAVVVYDTLEGNFPFFFCHLHVKSKKRNKKKGLIKRKWFGKRMKFVQQKGQKIII